MATHAPVPAVVASQGAADPSGAAVRPVAQAAEDDGDVLPESPVSEESFESATIVPRSALADRDVDRADDEAPRPALKPPPPLEDVVAKIPADMRKALEELFRARFRTVRRITPEQLR